MFRHILLPLDLDDRDSALRAVSATRQIAETSGAAARIHALTVVPSYSMAIVGSFFPADFESKAHATARAALETFIAECGLENTQCHIAQGAIYDEIIKTADMIGCDLILLTAHRPALSDYLLGPNAARVTRHAKQSVLVVRKTGATRR